MKINRIICWMLAVMLIVGCSSLASLNAHTGHLIVTLTDTDGRPVTNAVVTVKTLNCLGLNAGVYESHFDKIRSTTDTNGIAHICFQFLTEDFDWFVYTPSHYSQCRLGQSESFGAVVVPSDYMNINTNTVDGLTKYNELKTLDESWNYLEYMAKFEPKSVTFTNNVIHRAVTGLYPKRNPQPMYAYNRYSISQKELPSHSEVISSNGIDYVKYDEVEFDLQKGAFLPPWGGRNDSDVGVVSDFKIVCYSVATNGVTEFFGWMEFAPGCGAYKRKKTGDVSFPSTYEADTNAVYLSRIPYRSYIRDGEDHGVTVEKLLPEDEYMVLRTRILRNEDTGAITNCHYSKIFGRMYFDDSIHFEGSVFNQRPNDPNLEHDITDRGRLDGSGRCRWP